MIDAIKIFEILFNTEKFCGKHKLLLLISLNIYININKYLASKKWMQANKMLSFILLSTQIT